MPHVEIIPRPLRRRVKETPEATRPLVTDERGVRLALYRRQMRTLVGGATLNENSDRDASTSGRTTER